MLRNVVRSITVVGCLQLRGCTFQTEPEAFLSIGPRPQGSMEMPVGVKTWLRPENIVIHIPLVQGSRGSPR